MGTNGNPHIQGSVDVQGNPHSADWGGNLHSGRGDRPDRDRTCRCEWKCGATADRGHLPSSNIFVDACPVEFDAGNTHDDIALHPIGRLLGIEPDVGH